MTSSRTFLPSLWDRDPQSVFASPFRSLQRDIDSLFSRFDESGNGRLIPQLDVKETDKEIVLSVEMPGVERDDIEVNLTNDVLTVRGEKKSEHGESDDGYVRSERTYGMFERALRVPAGIDPEKVRAEIAKGVLQVTLEKPAEAENVQRKIEIKTAA